MAILLLPLSMPVRRGLHICIGCAIAVLLMACSQETAVVSPFATQAITVDAATRSTPVVPGRPARVFVFTALGDRCEAVPAPTVRVLTPPASGAISFRDGQRTTVTASANGRCLGAPAVGTGVYYTARAGAVGTDRFALEARAADGTTQSRTFEVRIEP